jgi:hypothetical protein
MRFIGIVSLMAIVLILASCGNKGGRGFVTSDYPVMHGTYAYNFHVTGDADNVVGTLVNEDSIDHLSTTVDGKNIAAYDGHGRVYAGTFSTTDGAFSITTDDASQHQVIEITITGNFDEAHQTGSGTFTMTFVSGFGNEDGAAVTGTWLSEIV